MVVKQYLDGLLHLLFPWLCMACDKSLLAHEEILCPTCVFKLPFGIFI